MLFCLCKTCAIECNFSGECANETVEERALSETLFLDEIWLSLQKCYNFLEIFEVYEYEVTQYDPCTCEGGVYSI